jgi:predicted dinucleotide-binding enzyme
MKVAIIGSSVVGQALAKGFVLTGHEVVIATRDPSSPALAEFLAAHSSIKALQSAEATAWADLIVLATKWSGTENAIKIAEPANFVGKVLQDLRVL